MSTSDNYMLSKEQVRTFQGNFTQLKIVAQLGLLIYNKWDWWMKYHKQHVCNAKCITSEFNIICRHELGFWSTVSEAFQRKDFEIFFLHVHCVLMQILYRMKQIKWSHRMCRKKNFRSSKISKNLNDEKIPKQLKTSA